MKSLINTRKYFKNGKLLTGFTIIELVVSIFILSIAVVGVFSAFSMVTILTSDTADQLTATYLAQEGMEIVRNIRDTNWLNMDAEYCAFAEGCPVSWVYGLVSLPDCSSGTPGCHADYTSDSMLAGSGGHLYLKNDNKDALYDYNENGGGTPTKFERKIIVDPITDVDGDTGHIIKVIIKVSWDKKATILGPGVLADDYSENNCVTAEETLYDWYNYEYR